MAAFGGKISGLLLILGILVMMFSYNSPIGHGMIIGGVALFGLTVVFQIINLPVEFDASRRAKAALVEYGMVHESEMKPVSDVLSAAALTYVAATLTAIMTLLYYLYRLGLLGNSRS